MTAYKSVYLKKGREKSIERRHPWIFSGGIGHREKGIKNGEVIYVKGPQDNVVATGHFQDGSIMCRVLAFDEKEINASFYTQRFNNAYEYRKNCIGIPNGTTNAFRLIHGEGDGLPGLIIDVYGSAAVVQCHSVGMARDVALIRDALIACEVPLSTIYNRSKEAYDFPKEGMLWGEEVEEEIVLEHGNKFKVNWATGQKTGFFLDQRVNRQLVGEASKGRAVLNLFCYTGGFSIYALNQGAKQVTSVDISQAAMDLVDANVLLANAADRHESITANVMEYIKAQGEELPYDVIIVDPPAFAKSVKKRHNAIQAYKRLNVEVLRRCKPGTMVFTFSCSQVVDQQLFKGAILAAGIESNRAVRIIKQLSQGGDHPVNLFHPEGHYLKGLMMEVS